MFSRKNRVTRQSDALANPPIPEPEPEVHVRAPAASRKAKAKLRNSITAPEEDDDDVQILEVQKPSKSKTDSDTRKDEITQLKQKSLKSSTRPLDTKSEKLLNVKDKKDDAQILKLRKASKSLTEINRNADANSELSTADAFTKKSEKTSKQKDKYEPIPETHSSGKWVQPDEVPLPNQGGEGGISICSNVESKIKSQKDFPDPMDSDKQVDKAMSEESDDDEDEDSQKSLPPQLSPRSDYEATKKLLVENNICFGRIRGFEPKNDGTSQVYWDSFSPPSNYSRELETIGMPPEPEVRLSPSVRMFHLMGKNSHPKRRTKRPNKLEEDVKAFKLKLMQEKKLPDTAVKIQTSNDESPVTSRNSDNRGSRRINFESDLKNTTEDTTANFPKANDTSIGDDDSFLIFCTQTVEENYQKNSESEVQSTHSSEMDTESSSKSFESTYFSPIKPILPPEQDKLLVKRKLWESKPVYELGETESKKFKPEAATVDPVTATTTSGSENFGYQEMMEEDGEGDDFLSQLVLPQLSSESTTLGSPIGRMALGQNSSSTIQSDDEEDGECFDSDFLDAITKLEEKELAKPSSNTQQAFKSGTSHRNENGERKVLNQNQRNVLTWKNKYVPSKEP